MQILYLIGNGFDINAHLDTGAKNFVKKLKCLLESRQGELSEGAQLLLKSLKDDIETWADFEMALGQFTADVEGTENPSSTFEEAYAAFHDYFSDEIEAENARARDVEISQEVAVAFRKGMVSVFDDVMAPAEKSVLNNAFKNGGCSIRFITFNYTCLLDRLVDMGMKIGCDTRKGGFTNLEAPLHIHGTLDDGVGILIGVDNEEQISGTACRESDDVRNMLVKPVSNDRIGMLRDESAERLIESSDIIAVYGMSMGDSDARWWERLGAWLSNQSVTGRLLVIARHLENRRTQRHWVLPRFKDSVIDEFLDKAGIGEGETRARLRSRILVAANSSAFDLNVSMPNRKEAEGEAKP